MSNDDPTEWPAIKGSHGMKPAVGPYHITDPARMEFIVLSVLDNIREKPWPGDRIAEGTMRGILTMAWHMLSEFGYYDREDDEIPDTNGTGPARRLVRKR